MLFKYLGNYGHGRIDWIGDDEDECLGGRLSDSSGKLVDNSSINLITREINELIVNERLLSRHLEEIVS